MTNSVSENLPRDTLLLVIPTILSTDGNQVLLDEHFANNLCAYLKSFEQVTVACPAGMPNPNMIPLFELEGHERCRVIVLPEPYREDRYIRNRRTIANLLREEILKADYLLISPHSALDWSTLATRIAIKLGRDYNMEGDWDLQNVVKNQLSNMPWGLRRLRKTIWHLWHTPIYLDSLRKSRLALLQGASVFEAYRDIAPNPQKVLNVQVTSKDRITTAALEAKLAQVRNGAPLQIIYTGRVIPMKGPEEWLLAMHYAFSKGLNGEAFWYGAGESRERCLSTVRDWNLAKRIHFPGSVDRAAVADLLKSSHVFAFAHLTDESPRCLTEALASGTPIIGFQSLFAQDLVAIDGGGLFTKAGDWQGLGALLLELDQNRSRLASLIEAAHLSSFQYDRDKAIEERINLMRVHLRRPSNKGDISSRGASGKPLTIHQELY